MTGRQQPGFDPDDLIPGEICTVRFRIDGTTRAEFVRRTRNPGWFIERRWNPHERRWGAQAYPASPQRLHQSPISRPTQIDETGDRTEA